MGRYLEHLQSLRGSSFKMSKLNALQLIDDFYCPLASACAGELQRSLTTLLVRNILQPVDIHSQRHPSCLEDGSWWVI